MMSCSQYLIRIFMKFGETRFRKKVHERGSHSPTCVGNGEVLFLGRHVA